MKEENKEDQKRIKNTSESLNKRMNSLNTCRNEAWPFVVKEITGEKENLNSCIKIIQSKNRKKNASFSYACVVNCIQFLLIKLLNTTIQFYSSKKNYQTNLK